MKAIKEQLIKVTKEFLNDPIELAIFKLLPIFVAIWIIKEIFIGLFL